jgi:hypothetical protein
VSEDFFDLKKNDDVRTALVPARRFGRAIYVAAAGLATLGWFWLIAWCALQLI